MNFRGSEKKCYFCGAKRKNNGSDGTNEQQLAGGLCVGARRGTSECARTAHRLGVSVAGR